MKRLLAVMALMLLPALAQAQNYGASGNSLMNGTVGANGTLTDTNNQQAPYGSTSQTVACPAKNYIHSAYFFHDHAALGGMSMSPGPMATSGDLVLAFVTSFFNAPIAPAGWTVIGSVQNGAHDFTTAYYRVLQTGDPSSWVWTNLGYPKGEMRLYRGYTGVDASVSIPAVGATNNPSTILNAPVMPVTAHPCEEVVFYASQQGAVGSVSTTGGLIELGIDNTGWNSITGAAQIPAAGAIPSSGLGVFSTISDQWTGYVVTIY